MTLYSKDDCPRCDVLKAKLSAKNISFVEISDENIIESKGIEFLPVLEVDGKLLKLSEANEFIKTL